MLAEDLNFTVCRANNDVWFKPAKKANRTRCHICVLVCTDDILCMVENPKTMLDKPDQHFLLKPESRKIQLGSKRLQLTGRILF